MKAAGWIAAVVMLMGAVGAFVWGMAQQRQAADLQARLSEAEQSNTNLKATLDEMGKQVDKATAEVAALEERVEKFAPAPEEAAASTPFTEGGEGAEALKAMMNALQKPSGENADGKKQNPLAAMFSGEQGKEMARMSAQMSIPAMYGGLFKDLNLPPETEARVREILTDSMAEQISMGFDVMNKEGDPEEIKKNMEAHGETLRNELAKVLTKEELAVYDEYEAGKTRRMLESSLDMQLSMFASGLTDENRTMFRDVLVEEMLAGGTSIDDPENYTNPGVAIDRQMAAFTAARDRVVPVIDESQAAHVDAFVQQMENMMNAQRQFMENLMSDAGESDAESPDDAGSPE